MCENRYLWHHTWLIIVSFTSNEWSSMSAIWFRERSNTSTSLGTPNWKFYYKFTRHLNLKISPDAVLIKFWSLQSALRKLVKTSHLQFFGQNFFELSSEYSCLCDKIGKAQCMKRKTQIILLVKYSIFFFYDFLHIIKFWFVILTTILLWNSQLECEVLQSECVFLGYQCTLSTFLSYLWNVLGDKKVKYETRRCRLFNGVSNIDKCSTVITGTLIHFIYFTHVLTNLEKMHYCSEVMYISSYINISQNNLML